MIICQEWVSRPPPTPWLTRYPPPCPSSPPPWRTTSGFRLIKLGNYFQPHVKYSPLCVHRSSGCRRGWAAWTGRVPRWRPGGRSGTPSTGEWGQWRRHMASFNLSCADTSRRPRPAPCPVSLTWSSPRRAHCGTWSLTSWTSAAACRWEITDNDIDM